MSHEVETDEASCLVVAGAALRWDELETRLGSTGLTLSYLVDAAPNRTIGQTLGAPEWLPTLWPAHTSRAACEALEASGHDGRRYASVVAPRTSSGPDIRAFFMGSGGRFGTVTRVWLRAERRGPVRWLRAPEGVDAGRLRGWLVDHVSVVTLHADALGFVARVRLGTRVADCALEAAAELGLEDGTPAERRWQPRVVVTAPWPERIVMVEGRQLLGAGPTHVAVGFDASTGAEVAWSAAREFATSQGGPVRCFGDLGEVSAPEPPGVEDLGMRAG